LCPGGRHPPWNLAQRIDRGSGRVLVHAGVVAITDAAVRTAPVLLEMPVEAMGPMLAGGALARVSGVAAIWAFVRLLRSQGFH